MYDSITVFACNLVYWLVDSLYSSLAQIQRTRVVHLNDPDVNIYYFRMFCHNLILRRVTIYI